MVNVFMLLVALGSVCSGQHRAHGSRPVNRLPETIQFHSKLANATLPYNLILPPDYDKARTTRYSVLYLLHGFSGHYSDWITRTNIADYATQYSFIVVMPEGTNGWYTDSANVATDKYESYILQELIPDVQKRYRTIEARYGRAIAGLSMGGYGSFKFGLKYPSSFVFVGSMSGAFGVTRYTEKETGSGSPWETFLRLFGPVGSTTRKDNDLFELIRQLPPSRLSSLPYFYFDCGTEDSPQIFDANRELSELMLQKNITHEYRELPGNHSWAYWDQQVQEVLRAAAQKLRLPSARANHDPGSVKAKCRTGSGSDRVDRTCKTSVWPKIYPVATAPGSVLSCSPKLESAGWLCWSLVPFLTRFPIF